MKILVPNRYLEVNNKTVTRESPLIFLAGPVRGGGDWQVPMSHILEQKLPGCTLAIPCRWGSDHMLYTYFAGEDTKKFARQLNWERFYLQEAGIGENPGCILFWLGLESRDHPHPGPEPYSMDTRGELGEWRARMKFESARVVIGAEEGYHGLSQIQRNFSEMLGYDFPIYPTLAATAEAALKMALK